MLDDVEDSDDEDERDFRRRTNKSKTSSAPPQANAVRPIMSSRELPGRKRMMSDEPSHQPPYKQHRGGDSRHVPSMNASSSHRPHAGPSHSSSGSFPRPTASSSGHNHSGPNNQALPSLMGAPPSTLPGAGQSIPQGHSNSNRPLPHATSSQHRPVHSRLGAAPASKPMPLPVQPPVNILPTAPSFPPAPKLDQLTSVRPTLPPAAQIATVKPLAPKPRCRDYDGETAI